MTVPVSADARHRGEARRPALVGARTTGANEATPSIVRYKVMMRSDTSLLFGWMHVKPVATANRTSYCS